MKEDALIQFLGKNLFSVYRRSDKMILMVSFDCAVCESRKHKVPCVRIHLHLVHDVSGKSRGNT